MAKKLLPKDIKKLTSMLNRIEKKLIDLSIEVTTSNETKNAYWAKKRIESNKLYDQARIIYKKWNDLNVPYYYKKNIADQVKRIKSLSFQPKQTFKTTQFINKDVSKQTIKTNLNDSINSFFIGTSSGQKKLNQLFLTTQQLNVQEKQINQSIDKGFIEKGSVGGAKKGLQKTLLKNAVDGKFIVVINKNGKPINYQLDTYAELVAKTKIREAQTEGTINMALSTGGDLVQVSSHNTKTPYDAQFEGKIFSISGNSKDFPRAEDLPPFHPNCRHSITVVFQEGLEANGTLNKLIKKSNKNIDYSLKPGG